MNDISKNCKYRHDNGNCLEIGDLCLAVDDDEHCIKIRECTENCESEVKGRRGIMKKIKICRNTNGDSRVATKVPTFSEFNDSNLEHCANVSGMMSNFATDIIWQGKNHDWTKKNEPYRSVFYRDMCNTIEGRMKFEDGEWNKLHYATERHHLLRNVPDDVNLIDVIEMIADCVCAGMARSGEVRPLEIDESILTKAINNTVKLMAESVELQEGR